MALAIYYGWIPPRSKKQPKRQTVFTPLKVASNPRMEEHRRLMEKCPSVGVGIGNATVTRRIRYDDEELAAREAEARQVKHTVAPICNKGGYQLITGNDIKTMGRKV